MDASAVIRRPKDFALGLLFVLGAIGLAYFSRDYTLGTAREMGPGYLPLLLAGCLAVLGVILAGQSFFGPYEPAENVFSRPLLVILASVSVFGFLLRPAGVVVAILALIVGASFAHPEHRLGRVIAFAVAMAGGCVLLFAVLLGQQIPLRGYWF
jgi:hypothetical protein